MPEKKTPMTRQVPLNRIYPENLQTYFVSNMVVQHDPDIFILSFFEAFAPPILGDSPDEIKSFVEKIEKVDAKCVARIVVTPSKMKEFVHVLTDNLNKYIKAFEFNNE